MMFKRPSTVSLVLAGVLGSGSFACGSGEDVAPAAPDAGPPAWASIIESGWTLQPGQEKYFCASKTVSEDVYIGGFRPIAPLGTHHTLLTFGPPKGADNPGSDCGPGTESAQWIYASGVGTNEMKMPSGVGVKIPAGQQVHVNLHLFNTSDQVLSGNSGVEILALDAGAVVNEAEIFLPGPLPFTIPNGASQQITGNCTLQNNQHFVALFPHMHQLGRHFKTEIVHADQSVTVLYDGDYSFSDQTYKMLDNMEVAYDDHIRTTCTYDNLTGAPVPFGNSSTQEMCVSMFIRYPRLNAAGATGVLCIQ